MNEKISLRLATVSDARQLLAIYAPYVLDTTVSFEYEVPSEEEFSKRISNILQKFPYYVALAEGEIVGYAYASPYRMRAAYNWVVETTIYIKQDFRGYGIGSKLYSALEETLKTQGVLTMLACIAYPNPPSSAFHETVGFQRVGHFSKSGYKLGRWIDIVWMEKQIGLHHENPSAVIPFLELDEA
ncbi:MAG: N-acetyltransferase family protein [Clostridia bacterium]|nr:GNAT family N-acetyltransferase [Anaerotignum sp.]NCC16039.1 N-acetyltransferase family protein [Clostridia bacterium]